MYVLETWRYRSRSFNRTVRTEYSYTLHHMTAAEFMAAKREERFHVGLSFESVTGAYAHRYVKRGGCHTTPLYLDYDRRIRFAKG
jgi:hypothetical protein